MKFSSSLSFLLCSLTMAAATVPVASVAMDSSNAEALTVAEVDTSESHPTRNLRSMVTSSPNDDHDESLVRRKLSSLPSSGTSVTCQTTLDDPAWEEEGWTALEIRGFFRACGNVWSMRYKLEEYADGSWSNFNGNDYCLQISVGDMILRGYKNLDCRDFSKNIGVPNVNDFRFRRMDPDSRCKKVPCEVRTDLGNHKLCDNDAREYPAAGEFESFNCKEN